MKFEIYKDHLKQYRWRLKASNGYIVADSSEGYVAKSDCQRGIDLVKSASNALVTDLTVSSLADIFRS